LNTFLTILTGVSVFVLGQIILKLFIDPIQEFKRVIAEISHILIERANIYANPGKADIDKEQMVSIELRNISSKLNAQMYLVPLYKQIAKIFRLPAQENVMKASSELIGLSNGFAGNYSKQGIMNMYRAQHIRTSLNIAVSENEKLSLKDEGKYIN